MSEVLTTAEIFERLQKPTVKLGFERAAEKLPLGASKFGGNPSAPRDFVWPFYHGKSDDGATVARPLTFLMQLNLEEVAPYDVEKRLPTRGLLAFLSNESRSKTKRRTRFAFFTSTGRSQKRSRSRRRRSSPSWRTTAFSLGITASNLR